MVYYEENGFNDYIETYKQQIDHLWKSDYLPTDQGNIIQIDAQCDNFTAHVFKKRKLIQHDELDIYLKDPPIDPFKTHNVLAWWKVDIIYCICYVKIRILCKENSKVKYN